jgi:dipeptidyl aminopeptidase/acylaminoacyl peptidase
VNLWLRDGSGIVYSANDASPNDFHLYRWDFASRTATRLLAKEGAWTAFDVTGDGKRMLVSHHISASNIENFELDVASGSLHELTVRPEAGTAASRLVGYMPGEGAVLVQSDKDGGRAHLFVRDLATGDVREPLADLSGFELDAAKVDLERTLLAAVTNEDGYGVIHVYTLPAFTPLTAPTEERGYASNVSFRERTLVWSLSNARRPGQAFATTYPASAGKSAAKPTTRQLTWTDTQGIDFTAFRLPEVVRYKAFDGREIPAFLYLPVGAKKGTPIPFVVTYHGGPEGQSRPQFEPITQYLLTRGFGVLLPNVRGSTGYGREYHMLDDYRKRWDSVRDGVDAADWLVAQGYATPGRVATFGQSYGGFMSVACVVEDAERVEKGARTKPVFGACVDVVGIVNMKTFLEETSGYRRKLREVEYGPLTDTEFLDSVSSIRRADKIKVPVFIAHGFNDPRVPVQEAMQLATKLKAQGNQPRLFVAPDEGHGFQKLDNRIYFYERMAQFLEETIGRDMATTAAN